jgi:hypothetical protein
VQGIPLRSREIVPQLLARLPGLLGDDISELLARLEGAMASSTGSVFDTPPCCRDSQRALLLRRADALPAVLEALRGECEALAAAPSGRPGDPSMPGRHQVLRLQEEDSVDEDAALASIARRHASRASLPLMLLGQRFGVLFARPAMSAEVLPLGPRAFCAGLREAATRIGLCQHARMALYRLYDVEFMDQYPRFAEALDALVDDAGILQGLAYVPLRRGAAPIATAVAQASEQDALQSVNRAAEALAPQGALPPRAQVERQEAILAMARYLLRHGRDSSQWSECIGVADTMMEAAREGGEAPAEAGDWLRRAIEAVGYGEGDADRLVSGLTTRVDAPQPGASAAVGSEAGAERHADDVGDGGGQPGSRERGVREQRCFDRLLLLAEDATIGFSAGDGSFVHVRVREHLPDPARLLLAMVDGAHEIVFEVDMLARMIASGQAWLVRAPAAAIATAAGTGAMP